MFSDNENSLEETIQHPNNNKAFPIVDQNIKNVSAKVGLLALKEIEDESSKEPIVQPNEEEKIGCFVDKYFEAAGYCLSCCAYLCESCKKNHEVDCGESKAHFVISLEEKNQAFIKLDNPFCQTHQKELTIFCWSCKAVTCVDCALSHPNHIMAPLSNKKELAILFARDVSFIFFFFFFFISYFHNLYNY